MKKLNLKPDQIITLNDYPVHSPKVLTEYYSKCKLGESFPLVPVIRKTFVRKFLGEILVKELEKFEEDHEDAEYFMLDGSHRTTALNLGNCEIKATEYENDEDILDAKKLVKTGEVLQNGTLEKSFEENCEGLKDLFSAKPYFMTVEEKTQKMIEERELPDEILKDL
jgi:hypothetical protein